MVRQAADGPRRVIRSLRLALVVLVPTGFMLHGIVWYTTGASSALLVYFVKVCGLLYLASFARTYRPRVLFRRSAGLIVGASILFLLTGLLVPLAYLPETSPFYYAADLIGTLTTVLYMLTAYYLLQRKLVEPETIYGVIEQSTLVICVYMIISAIVTGGEKVSTPTEVHYGIAVSVVRWLTADRGERKGLRRNLSLAVILLGAFASALRINYLIVGLSIVFGYAWLLGRRFSARSLGRVLAASVVLAGAMFAFRDRIADRVASVALQSTVDVGTGEVFQDASASQRFLEGILVVNEVRQRPLALIVGKGFGATYENAWNLIPHYDRRMHHVHASVLTILLRSGIFGVVLIFSIPLLAIQDVFSRDRRLFVAAHGVLMTYVALMTDQYLYWGLLYGLSIALWWHARRRVRGEVSARAAVRVPLIAELPIESSHAL